MSLLAAASPRHTTKSPAGALHTARESPATTLQARPPPCGTFLPRSRAHPRRSGQKTPGNAAPAPAAYDSARLHLSRPYARYSGREFLHGSAPARCRQEAPPPQAVRRAASPSRPARRTDPAPARRAAGPQSPPHTSRWAPGYNTAPSHENNVSPAAPAACNSSPPWPTAHAKVRRASAPQTAFPLFSADYSEARTPAASHSSQKMPPPPLQGFPTSVLQMPLEALPVSDDPYRPSYFLNLSIHLQYNIFP